MVFCAKLMTVLAAAAPGACTGMLFLVLMMGTNENWTLHLASCKSSFS